jgi:hypothetical protein
MRADSALYTVRLPSLDPLNALKTIDFTAYPSVASVMPTRWLFSLRHLDGEIDRAGQLDVIVAHRCRHPHRSWRAGRASARAAASRGWGIRFELL